MRYEIKDYVEVSEWRQELSAQLGTYSKALPMLNGVHWVSKHPGKEWFDSVDLDIQYWNPSAEVMDTFCSLYSLYYELQCKHDIPDLMRGQAPVIQYAHNKKLLKRHLPLCCNYEWPELPEWSNWTIAQQKRHFKECVRRM